MKSTASFANTSKNAEPQSLLSFLKLLVHTRTRDSYIVRADLYIRSYTNISEFDKQKNVLTSTFGKNGYFVVSFTFHSACTVAILKNATFELRDYAGSTDGYKFQNETLSNDVYGVDLTSNSTIREVGGKNTNITILTAYDPVRDTMLWSLGDGSRGDEILLEKGYEKCQSITGQFPLVYIINYLDIARFRVFSGSGQASNIGGDVGRRSTYSARDFSVQLMAYLEHISKSRRQNDEMTAEVERKLSFKLFMSCKLYLVKPEMEKLNTNESEIPKESKLKVNRIF